MDWALAAPHHAGIVFEEIFASLEREGARYVVVGGFAVVMHGHARLTADIDLIIDLEQREARKAMAALTACGLRPRAPVPADDFADADKRRDWIEQKGMTVFSLWDPSNPLREVDVFVSHPVPFDELMARSVQMTTASGTAVRVASIDDLIVLKQLAGRERDLQDIEALRALRGSGSEG